MAVVAIFLASGRSQPNTRYRSSPHLNRWRTKWQHGPHSFAHFRPPDQARLDTHNIRDKDPCTMSRVLPNPGPLQVERRPDGRRRLLRCLKVDVSPMRDASEVQTVPCDFVMDYSSLPRGTRWAIHWVRVDVAGVLHDWLYRDPDFPRLRADWIWYRVARAGAQRVNVIQGIGGFVALALFGWGSKAGFGGHGWGAIVGKVGMGALDCLAIVALAWLACRAVIYLDGFVHRLVDCLSIGCGA